MEASAFNPALTGPAIVGRSPLLRLQPDERLIALTRRGNEHAFEALVQRYQPRLLAFCRHMLGSTEDAEDVLQEVFTASYNAMLGDNRPINARPWLYRIARNRCLNHLRRPSPVGQDSMDIFERDGGATTADTVHRREEFRQIVADVQDLPETQRTALLLREIDALSYDQIAEAMETTVPSVKSLLVRARVSLAEAAEARLLTCEEAREELGKVAEGLQRSTAPVRRHVRGCDRCATFKRELRRTNAALAAVYPLGPLVILKKFFFAKLGAAGAGGGAAAGGTAGAAGAGGVLSASLSTVASKAAAGVAAAAIVTAGAVEVRHVTESSAPSREAPVAAALVPPSEAPPARAAAEAATPVAAAEPARAPDALLAEARAVADETAGETAASAEPAPAIAENQATTTVPAPTTNTTPTPTAAPPAPVAADPGPSPSQGTTQEESDTTTIPSSEGGATDPDPVAPSPAGSPAPQASP